MSINKSQLSKKNSDLYCRIESHKSKKLSFTIYIKVLIKSAFLIPLFRPTQKNHRMRFNKFLFREMLNLFNNAKSNKKSNDAILYCQQARQRPAC